MVYKLVVLQYMMIIMVGQHFMDIEKHRDIKMLYFLLALNPLESI